MKFIKYLKSVRPIIHALAGIAIIIILFLEFWLKEIPEFFDHGYEIGEIVYKICLSIIASYVFYFIVVHIKAETDKENINIYVAEKIRRIVGRCTGQLNELAKFSQKSGEELWDDKDEIKRIFSNLNPRSQAPLLIAYPDQYADWLQYLDYYRRDTTNTIEKVFRKMPFLDSKLVALLAKLEDCSHFGSISSAVNMQLRNTDMEPWADCFYKYVQICKEIESYADEKLTEYKIETNLEITNT